MKEKNNETNESKKYILEHAKKIVLTKEFVAVLNVLIFIAIGIIFNQNWSYWILFAENVFFTTILLVLKKENGGKE